MVTDALPLVDRLLTTVTTGVIVCDMQAPDQPIAYVNPAFERISGYAAEDVIGRNCRFLQGDETAPLAVSLMREAIQRGDELTATLLNYRSDGTPFWNEIRLAPVGEEDSSPRYYLGLMSDVTRRVAAETSEEHADVLRSTVFHEMLEGVIVLDSKGGIADVNPSALAILSFDRDALRNRDWWDELQFRHPDGRPLQPSDSPGLKAFQEQRHIEGVPLLVRRGDGEDRLITFNYRPFSDHGTEQPHGMVVTFRDDTEAQRALEQLQQFAGLVETSEDFIALAALDGQVEFLNAAGRRLVGLDSLADARSRHIRDFHTEEGRRASAEVEQPAVMSRGHWEGESTLRHFKTGRVIPVRVNSYLVRHSETGEPIAQASVQRDISGEKRFTEDLIRSQERYQAQFRSLPLPTYVWQRQNHEFVLIEWNAAAEEATRGGIRGRRGITSSTMYPDAPEVMLGFERAWSTRSHLTQEQEYRMVSTGELKNLIVTYAFVPPDLVLVHTLDITQRVAAERRLQRIAERDDLTGLHNRRFFEGRLGEALGQGPTGVLIVDVDHFKFVNDSLGHKAGDELLREVADTMAGRLRDGDVLARFGGDEFAVLLDDCDADRAAAVANHLLAAIRSSVTGVSVTASCGAAMFATGATITASDAIVAADIALYEAKQAGRDRMELYTGQAGESLTWLEQIRAAIADDRLAVYGQAVVDLHGPNDLPAYELLVRMISETGQVIAPGSFLPTAEQFGLIREIDRWVVQRGIAFAGTSHRVSINLSARSLGDRSLPELIAQTIRETGADPSLVTFEFTETAAVSSVEDARAFTDALTELGCASALDDFGTGFGTFTLLKHLPVNALKIDVEFVRRLSTSAADQRIVRSIVQIASDHGMVTVAEGVEDAGAMALLREYGVAYAQGFHIARPAPLPR